MIRGDGGERETVLRQVFLSLAPLDSLLYGSSLDDHVGIREDGEEVCILLSVWTRK